MVRQRYDLEARVKLSLEACVKDGFHIKRGICPEVKRSTLRRSLGLPIKKNQVVSYKKMFKMVYAMWLSLGLNETHSDFKILWQLYYDLRDS
jgi:hypothetical protein